MSNYVDKVQKEIKTIKDVISMMLGSQRKQHDELVSLISALLPSLLQPATTPTLQNDWSKLPEKEKKDVVNAVVDGYEIDVGVKTYDPNIIEKKKESEYWLYKVKDKVSHQHFDRYKQYLIRDGFSAKIVSELESTCEKILSRCANPKTTANVDRKKGLVVGDVQSGKTSNYLGLINMAYDYGYKIVVLLAGTTNSLRLQTQKRADQGTIGAKSDSIGNDKIEYIGVGEGPQKYYVIPFTDQGHDFVKYIKDSSHVGFDDLKKPAILVVKKNKGVLEAVSQKLQGTLDSLQSQSGDEHFDSRSILIIDDEADYAGINVKKDANNPTAINGCIRDIFSKFPVATYVGFTATPFANIFINPDDGDLEKRDLFPSDFIVQLNAPSNYFGGRKVFPRDDDDLPDCLYELDENEDAFLPVVHPKTVSYPCLAESLKHAIHCFLINNVIRTLRGHKTKHRSMMINITRFNEVQSEILYRVQAYITILRNAIEQYSAKKEQDFVKDKNLKKVHDIFCEESFYSKIRSGSIDFDAVDWPTIQHGLFEEIKQLQVVVINSRNGNVEQYDKNGSKKRFDYDDYKEDGARVIAIGGLVLSRGLTLEGLMVSYYSRNAKAYDTLLQMCRWFGYRPKYEDLCRIYMTTENVSCFSAVLDAVENLKEQFAEMERQGKKPQDFGLMVKESPDSLATSMMVTSRNKMRDTDTIEVRLNYGGVAADTSKLYKKKEVNDHNLKELYKFAQEISIGRIEGEKHPGKLRVAKSFIADFIRNLEIPYINTKFDVDGLSTYIDSSKIFMEWDVVIAEGDSKESSFFSYLEPKGKECSIAVQRQFHADESYFRIGRHNNRVMEPGIFEFGMTKDEIECAKNERKGKNVIVEDYLHHRERPLLVIYPIDLKTEEDLTRNQKELGVKASEDLNKKSAKDLLNGEKLLAFAIGFPGVDSKERLVYRANKRKIEEFTHDVEIDDDEEGSDEQDD